MNRPRIRLAWQAVRWLGVRAVAWYGVYFLRLLLEDVRLALRPSPSVPPHSPSAIRPLPLPAPHALRALLPEDADLLAEAEDVLEGRVRLFGGEPVPLRLKPPGPLAPWTAYELGRVPWGVEDVKFLWEPARFGWAFTLGRAFCVTGQERFAEAFWRYAEDFWRHNPPFLGPNWASGQEVALRLIALAWSGTVFVRAACSTPERMTWLADALAAHAERIPPTLAYARAQNNNHLLSEAAGLITAAVALPGHPHASRWRRLGRRWWRWGIAHQIAPDGAYIQHSTNYHRLMLQLALWVAAIAPDDLGDPAPLARATRWLLALCEPQSGRVPNFGPNDGAYVLPLTGRPFHDYRPVLQAAARRFLGQAAFPPGPWDDMALWLGGSPSAPSGVGRRVGGSLRSSSPAWKDRAEERRPLVEEGALAPDSPLRLATSQAHAFLRVAHFTSRPGHADQLHLDLWWREFNLTLDAGTYRYTAAPPWDNALTHAAVHNTVTVNGQDQMTRVGRFLYLDWAQARVLRYEPPAHVVAEHDGYRRLGVRHRRAVTALAEDHWQVVDDLLPAHARERGAVTARLHWLLPDVPWEIATEGEAVVLTLRTSLGQASLRVTASAPCRATLIRAGERLFGDGPVQPTWGWASPTYGQKVPALSFALVLRGPLPLQYRTHLRLGC